MKNAQALGPAHSMALRELLLCRRALRGLGAGQDRVTGAGACEQDGEAKRGEHEADGGVGGELGQQVGGSAGAECSLRALAAEGAGEIGGLALLEQDDADEEERDDDVDDDNEDDHRVSFATSEF